MKIKNIKEKLIYLMAVGLSIFLLFFFITTVWIGYEVQNLCQNAKWQYGGDCVGALSAQLDDENQGYRNRNHSIWALGQLGDERAREVLYKYYTGVIPEREPLDKVVSQYELRKAVNLVNGGVNAGAFVWRWMVTN